MTGSNTHARIDLRLTDARARLRLELPPGWSWQLVPAPSRADPEGKVTPRLVARRDAGGLELKVGASYLPLPSGLAHAAAYWCLLYELDVPKQSTLWEPREAFIGYSSSATKSAVCMIWVKAANSVIELRIEADATASRDELIEWLRQHLECEPIAVDEPSAPEPWWTRVKKLRERGLLDEAVSVAERDGDRAEALLVQAELHVERMRRAEAAGQSDIAREAWHRASACACTYAASATSGGEGAARSLERDRVLAQLGPEPK